MWHPIQGYSNKDAHQISGQNEQVGTSHLCSRNADHVLYDMTRGSACVYIVVFIEA
ncbi:hypothetical protein Mapa_004406 [Marchantia paleacea]|nr:hypothetical protein Mapa_004406 [Marchantia paleacea]